MDWPPPSSSTLPPIIPPQPYLRTSPRPPYLSDDRRSLSASFHRESIERGTWSEHDRTKSDVSLPEPAWPPYEGPTTYEPPTEGAMMIDARGLGPMGRSASFAKGRERSEEGMWENENGRDVRGGKGLPEVDRDMALLHTHLTELIHLMTPFASIPGHLPPPRPPAYLHARLTRLAAHIHATLLSLQPHVHLRLDPAFSRPMVRTPSASLPRHSDSSLAEKEMEAIRLRRDALIARAAANAAQNHPAGHTTWRSESAQSQNGRDGYSELDPYSVPQDTMIRDLRGGAGRCHGCGIVVSEGWMAGPDGPNTLCTPCGMHYAHLAKERFLDGIGTENAAFP